MTARGDGTAVCDRCGGDVGNGGIAQAAVITWLDVDGQVHYSHLCLTRDGTRERCATRVLTRAAMAHLVDSGGTDGVPLFDPAVLDAGPVPVDPDEPVVGEADPAPPTPDTTPAEPSS